MDIFLDMARTAASTDVFAAGLALGLVGAAVALASRILGTLLRLVMARVAVDLTIDNRTAAFRHLTLWLHESGVVRRSRRHQIAPFQRGQPAGADPILMPAEGRHWFWREGHLCCLSLDMDDKIRVGVRNDRPREQYHLRVIGPDRRRALTWLAEGARLTEAEDRTGPQIHGFSDSYWSCYGPTTPRAMETVITDDDTPARLLADLRWFLSAADWYTARGVPWRRGYLLHGPPGTGKSSLIRALASNAHLDLALIDLGQATLTDDDLREAMVRAPDRALLVMEDIDAAFTKRKGKGAGVSFSGLLNAIDGVAAQEGRALIMTTNHRDRLDPALIRPGRVDVDAELSLIGAEAAGRLFARFFPGEAAGADRFIAALGQRRFAPAALQGWLLAHADDPAQAARADGLIGTEDPLLAAE